MKVTYKCRGCGEKNSVDVTDIFTMGMGRDGVSANEFGLGAMFGSTGPLSGFPGMPGGGRLPKEIVHSCVHCGAKNLIS